MTISGRPERTGARIERRAAGGLHVDRLAFDFTMSYDAGPLEKLCLITVDRGVHTSGGDVCGPGETFLVALPGRPYAGEVRAARYTITMFDAGLLDQATEGGERVRLSGRPRSARRRTGCCAGRSPTSATRCSSRVSPTSPSSPARRPACWPPPP
ncbi:hypothetical protein [Streptomyces sp. NPDC017949]|uniref:hypothetical protein n=1 Tax=Streptomyces sp. NPDC017949 TaxID=3365020 RepID=UPI0037ACA17E